MTSSSADIGAVLAGLRSASSEERIAAAKRVEQLTDLNLVPAEEERTAVSFHKAAAALARGGVCAALAAMLRVDAEQQLACTALRCIFNVLHFLHNHQAELPARWASVAEDVTSPGSCVANPALPPPPPAPLYATPKHGSAHDNCARVSRGGSGSSALWRLQLRHAPTHAAALEVYDAGGAERLCGIFQSALDHTSAGNAVSALRLLALVGWHDRLEACLNTDAALSSLFAFAGGELQPRRRNAGLAALELLKTVKVKCGTRAERARPFCSPQVLCGGAVATLVALYAYGSKADEESATQVLAGQLLFFTIETERVAARNGAR